MLTSKFFLLSGELENKYKNTSAALPHQSVYTKSIFKIAGYIFLPTLLNAPIL